MLNSPLLKRIRSRNLDVYAALLVALAYCLFILLFVQFRHVYEFDPDEGNNVIKSLLLDQGFVYFDQIWSDQPPLFSYLLWAVFEGFGWEMVNGRLLIVLFSAAIVFALYDTMRLEVGHLAGLSAAIFIIVSHRYIQYSVSIMLGIPSLSLAAMAIWALSRWRHQQHYRYLLISGGLLAGSLSIKMFTAILIPMIGIFIVYSSIAQGAASPRELLKRVGGWLCVMAAVALVCFLPVILAEDSSVLIEGHAIASSKSHTLGKKLLHFIKTDWALFGLAGIGLGVSVIRRQTVVVVFALWFLASLVIYYRHYPVWSHHVTMLTIPGAALAGLSTLFLAQQLQRWISRPWVPFASGLLLTIFAAVAVISTDKQRPKEFTKPQHSCKKGRDSRAQQVIEQYVGKTKNMVTARQIFAFNTRANIPPQLAVTSYKRFVAKLLTASEVIDHIYSHRAEIVILSDRWNRSVRDEIKAAILDDYERVYRDKKNRKLEIHVRRDLIPPEHGAPAETP